MYKYTYTHKYTHIYIYIHNIHVHNQICTWYFLGHVCVCIARLGIHSEILSIQHANNLPENITLELICEISHSGTNFHQNHDYVEQEEVYIFKSRPADFFPMKHNDGSDILAS